jgi:cysteine desulfurase
MVSTADVAAAIRPETILVSIMHANNETGTVQGKGVPMHTDAAQSAGKIPVDVGGAGCRSVVTGGAQAICAQGSGALYVRRGVRLQKLVDGVEIRGI